MALTDWREEESAIDGNFLFSDMKDKNNIPYSVSGIHSIGKRIGIHRVYPSQRYEFSLSSDYGKPIKIKKIFSSRNKALAFAKSYMRLH